ncbi:MAG: hypothetical protein KDA72_20795, partial [Planctomycetales bacterium]|nr:hypothetical protein [Planctomycetales bacterium]
MVQEYAVTKCSRRCSVSGRSLEPGESYVSVLVSNGEDLSRMDIAASEWKGPQENTVGWWKCKMPAATAKKLRPAPNGILLDTLGELLSFPDKVNLAYLLAVLLVRRRVLTDVEKLE